MCWFSNCWKWFAWEEYDSAESDPHCIWEKPTDRVTYTSYGTAYCPSKK